MTSPSISDKAVQEATGKTWNAWLELLHDIEAAALDHSQIAARLVSDYGVDGWWAQAITVEFERAIGRRRRGQTSSGHYAVSVSKTLPGDKDHALALWREHMAAVKTIDGVPLSDGPSESATEKWRYWRISLRDGSKVVVNFSDKGNGKALLQVSHEKLSGRDAVARWKSYWKGVIQRMTAKQVPR